MRAFLKALRYALHGLAEMVRSQRNARIHLVISALVLLAGLFFKLNRLEWMALWFAVGLVWCAEALNSAMETLADALHPRQSPKVGLSKDLAAAGVLCASLAAAAVGTLVFYPHLFPGS